MNAHEAIALSIEEDRTIRIDPATWDEDDMDTLVAEADADCDGEGGDYWGCDEDGRPWRVSVDTDCILTPVRGDDETEWSVACYASGRWWPDDATTLEIAESSDPAVTALRICREDPCRGEWHS